MERTATATAATNPSTRASISSTLQGSQAASSTSAIAEPPAGHQRFVLTDPLAFRYLSDDLTTRVLERHRQLDGYECYIVEQWSTSRSHPTSTITTYTGDLSHSVVVGVLSIPKDESTWSPKLRVYFKALNQYHARRRETPLGIVMVTNLSGFPSSLTVIPVPEGDLRKHRADFSVNEDLKRLNCAGRVGLTLSPPAAATTAKFHQLYRTSDKNDIYDSVIELVKLCQSALMLFDKLEIDYSDGLLCDVTERAINDWWLEIGSSYYNVEPHDGILGPTTVAGLLGMLMGARNRLHSLNHPVPKDAFDVEGMKKGISAFQKAQRVQRTRRLDRRTLDRLHRTTAKAANHDGYWAVPKAVKSTVAELSGKGGEMVLDSLGRRDRAGIAEIETCDMERFVQLVQGARAKWLWYGKALKKTATKDFAAVGERNGEGLRPLEEGRQLSFKQDEHGGFTWTARKSVADGLIMGKGEKYDDAGTDEQDTDDDDRPMVGVLKRASGFKEAKSGIGKLTSAVGLGHHKHAASKDEPPQTPRSPQSPLFPQSPVEATPPPGSGDQRRRPLLQRAVSSPSSSVGSPQSPVAEKQKPSEDSIPEHTEHHPAPAYAASYREAPSKRSVESLRPPSYLSKDLPPQNGDGDPGTDGDASESVTVAAASIAGSIYNDVNLDDLLPSGPETEPNIGRLLKRTASYSRFIDAHIQSRSPDAYPRHLSFSLAEDSVLSWSSIVEDTPEPFSDDPLRAEMAEEHFLAQSSRHLHEQLNSVNMTTIPFTTSQLETLQSLFSHALDHESRLENLYAPHASQMQAMRADTEAVLRMEKERLEEAGKDIEMLTAKLEYEINGLKGRVEDVEAGVGDYEKGVGRVEERVGELERDGVKREGRCVVQ